MLMPMVASAQFIVEFDGIYFKLIENTDEAYLTNMPGNYQGWANIPPSITVNGMTYRVTAIAQYDHNKDGVIDAADVITLVNYIADKKK